jgi:hypothetical protein
VLPEQIHRLSHDLLCDVERGTKTDGTLAGLQNEQSSVKQFAPQIVASFRVWQIKSYEQPATTDA